MPNALLRQVAQDFTIAVLETAVDHTGSSACKEGLFDVRQAERELEIFLHALLESVDERTRGEFSFRAISGKPILFDRGEEAAAVDGPAS